MLWKTGSTGRIGMPSNYRPYQPEHNYLLPPSPSDWLPEKHLAFFISEVVD